MLRNWSLHRSAWRLWTRSNYDLFVHKHVAIVAAPEFHYCVGTRQTWLPFEWGQRAQRHTQAEKKKKSGRREKPDRRKKNQQAQTLASIEPFMKKASAQRHTQAEKKSGRREKPDRRKKNQQAQTLASIEPFMKKASAQRHTQAENKSGRREKPDRWRKNQQAQTLASIEQFMKKEKKYIQRVRLAELRASQSIPFHISYLTKIWTKPSEPATDHPTMRKVLAELVPESDGEKPTLIEGTGGGSAGSSQ